MRGRWVKKGEKYQEKINKKFKKPRLYRCKVEA